MKRKTLTVSVIDCLGMFEQCEAFNYPVTIPSTATSCRYMFQYTSSFNQPIDIPANSLERKWFNA